MKELTSIIKIDESLFGRFMKEDITWEFLGYGKRLPKCPMKSSGKLEAGDSIRRTK